MTEQDSIRIQSDAIAAMSGDWDLIDALMGGTPAMRAGGKKWLPRFPNEDSESHRARLASATLHPVFRRTVLVNAARPFSRSITMVEKTPQKVVEWTANIDMRGTTLAAFAVQLMTSCLSKGLTGVLVDYPKAEGIKTKADEITAGVRPYCVHYDCNSILGWMTEGAGQTLTQLRLLEWIEIKVGDYKTQAIEQIRVLTLGTWATFRKDDKGDWQQHEAGTTSLNFIPFVFFYGTRKGFGVGASPLRDLAYQNVEHWQTASDQQTILHVARVPILFAKMFGDTNLTIGAGSAATSDNEKAELKYVEHSGAAIEAGRQSILDLEDRMRSTGAELVSQKASYTTATQISNESDSAKSTLQQIVEVFEESLTLALNYMAAWVKEPQTSAVVIYKDFVAGFDTDPATLTNAVDKRVLSRKSAFEELQRRDIVSAERKWDDEQKRINQEAE